MWELYIEARTKLDDATGLFAQLGWELERVTGSKLPPNDFSDDVRDEDERNFRSRENLSQMKAELERERLEDDKD